MELPLQRSASLPRRLAFGLIFGFVVVLALLLLSDFRQVSLSVQSFHWYMFPLVLLFTLFNYTLRFVKWHFYLGQVGAGYFPVRESARLFVAGFPLAVTPGKVGEALKAVWLNAQAGVPTARGVAVVLAERITDGLGVLALSTLGVIAYPQYWPAFVIVMAGLLAIVIVSQIRPLALALLGLGEHFPVLSRSIHHLREFYEGSFSLFRPGVTLLAVGLGTVSWLGEGIGLYVILLGLGVPSGWETLFVAVFALSFSTVIGAVSALPGGLGAAEASIAGMLALLLQTPSGLNAAATLLIRFATLWFGVGLGLIVWLFSRELFFGEQGSSNPTGSKNSPISRTPPPK